MEPLDTEMAQDDLDGQVLRAAGNAVIELDVRYRLASFTEQMELGPERDRAFNAYAFARINLIRNGIVTTEQDVAEMQALQQQMQEAADKAALLAVAAKIAARLARIALLP